MQPRVLAVATLVEPDPLVLLPFVTMLLCLALLPFILKDRWEANYHLIALFLSTAAGAYYLFGIRQPERILREAGDYIHFIAIPTS